ncbi:vacuolar sorting protein [Theileria orientalis strain Shintoku]|uniref:Vacuolar sorting protein n=1 Tax=Theileria orientalis strain Shintoku TaxID=869250 RepID=J4C307_THEOR|nr:vacuolar sorting protein [Theileria orientalis strain Shintoku]BAM39611.1 vacuolar sorting protein [Theileria orientalis strain Shintoku]|eukprot:XP_009689912.1 vacuolar sorting protein [Theileria orientalis strain Shintoku]
MENWLQIGERNVRREVWQCSLIKGGPEEIKAIAPLGCMIAIVSNEIGPFQTEEESVKCVLKIYNGNCALVTSVKWYVRFDSILALHWTDGLELAAVFTNGCVRVYSPHGELLRSFYLNSYGPTSSNRMEKNLIQHKAWADGLVLVNMENQKMYIQRGFESQNSWLLDLGEYALSITALGVVPSESWSEVLVIMSTFQGTSYAKMDHLMKCTTYENVSNYLMEINPCTYTHISSSPYHYSDVSKRFNCKEGDEEAPENEYREKRRYVGMGNSEEGLLTSLCIAEESVKILWEIKMEEFNNIYTMSEGILAVTFNTASRNEAARRGSSKEATPSVNGEVNEGLSKGERSEKKESNILRLIYNAIHTINIRNYVIEILSDIGGGIRVYTRSKIEYMEVVTTASELALSNERGDVTNNLLKTFEMFKKGHEKSSEALYSIRDKLSRASKICLEASKDQWDFETALLLIEFSIFSSSLSPVNGKGGLDNERNGVSTLVSESSGIGDANEVRGHREYEKEHIIIISYLRLCKDLVNYNIFTNIRQLHFFGLSRLIGLLTNLKLYLLSIRICEFFRVNPTRVLLGWITTRIKLGTHLTDSELFSLITTRLEKYLGTILSYSKVAQVVFKQGREVLALSFIEKEKCTHKQFKVLMRWNELSRAAKVANESGDPALVNYIILKTTNKNDISNVVTLSKNHSLIRNMFIQQLHLSANEKTLQVFYERNNNVFEAGLNSIEIYNSLAASRESPGEREGRPKEGALRSASEEDLVKEMKYSLNYSNGYFGNKSTGDAAFWYEAVNNEMLLLEHQAALERSHEALKSARLVGRSVMETLFELYKLNLGKEAEALASLFKLPSSQTRCTKIAALYEAHNVQELVALVHDKQLAGTYIRSNKTYFHLLLQTLVSLGASNQVDAMLQAMKPAQQSYWRAFINQQGGAS